jgi:hypothetical protein
MAQKKSPAKKTTAKKASKKKSGPGKVKAKPKKVKAKPKKVGAKLKKAIPKEIVLEIVREEISVSADCKCKQKKRNGKFFCFRLVQGRWIQSSAVPFPTKELCEEANC